MENILQTLHPLERGVLPYLKEGISLTELMKASHLSEIEVIRALQWLENKEILKIKIEEKEVISLDENGLNYVENGLPERQLLNALSYLSKFKEIQESSQLSKEELNIALGVLRKKKAIDIHQENITLTDKGKEIQNFISEEEHFLRALPLEKLSIEQQKIFDELKTRRNIVKKEITKLRSIILTKKGKDLLSTVTKKKLDLDLIDSVTKEVIKTASWKQKPFRRYDIKINVPTVSGGKRHFVNEALEYTRQLWLELGFQEMQGHLIHTSFWNFDALFTAQDHPARDLQDTFYLKNPQKGKLPEKELVEKIKNTHEKGIAGSKGYNYTWDSEEARKNVLRTHTTVLSAHTLAALKDKPLPGKYFSLGKCFRNETVDWSHLAEFHQTEGIVIDEHATLQHLLGYLKEFFTKMGFPQVRFRPGHFPYTEPSVECDVFHPVHKKWIELGGAGIFRPEVVVPLLGKDVPVLAWGLGIERILIDYYKITDVRDMYKNDLLQLKEMKLWMRYADRNTQ